MVAVRRLFTMSWSRCARRGVRVRRTRKQKRKSTCRARDRGGKRELAVPGLAMFHRRFGAATATDVNTEQLLAFQKILVTSKALEKLAERIHPLTQEATAR